MGRRYAGGHEAAKAKTDEHGEKFVWVSKQPKMVKGKGRGKSSKTTEKDVGKVTVTKVLVTPKDMGVLALGEPPAESTRAAKRKKKDDTGDE